MVNLSTPVEVLFSTPAIKFYSKESNSNHNTKHRRRRSSTEPSYNRFRSRKPPKNPRELIVHTSRYKRILLENVHEPNVRTKTKQSKSPLLQLNDKVLLKTLGYLHSSQRIEPALSEPTTTLKPKPKFISKSKFVLNAKRPGSNSSLVVNPSKSKYCHLLNLVKSSKSLAVNESSNQDYTTSPSPLTKLKDKPCYYIMESEHLESRYESNNNEFRNSNLQHQTRSKIPKRFVSCTCPKNQRREIVWVDELEDDHPEPKNNPCFGNGFQDTYGRVLGPTPDETILAGLQTVIDMCSVVERNVQRKPSRASSNKDIMDWVENEYSSLEHDLKSNPSQTSLHNIAQRQETLQEIEKLVKKKSKLDEEALNKKSSSKSKLPSNKSCQSKTDTTEEDVEEEETENKETAKKGECLKKLSKSIYCSCSTTTSNYQSTPTEETKTQCTQTSFGQSSVAIQQPSTTTTSPQLTTTVSDTEEADTKSTTSYAHASTSTKQISRTELSTYGQQTFELETATKSIQTSDASDDDTSKSGLLSSKSIQASDCLQSSTKSVQCDLLPVLVEASPGSTKSLQTTLTPQQSFRSVQTSLTTEQSAKSVQTSLTPGHADKAIQISLTLEALSTPEPSGNLLKPCPQQQSSKSIFSSDAVQISSKSTQTSFSTPSSLFAKPSNALEIQKCPFEPSDVACQCNIINTVSEAKPIKREELKDKPLEVCCKESPLQEENQDLENGCICRISHLGSIQEEPKYNKESSSQSSASPLQEKASTKSDHEEPNETKSICLDSSEKEPIEKGVCYGKPCSETSDTKHEVKSAKKLMRDQSAADVCENSITCKISRIREKEIPKNVCGETCPTTDRFHLTAVKLPGRKKSRLLHKQKSRESYVEAQTCKAPGATTQTPSGDSLVAPSPREVRYAMVRITKFDHYSTFEVLSSTSSRPRFIPATTENIFVVRNKAQQ